MRALRSPRGLERLTRNQQDTLREAADIVLLASASDCDTEAALLDARTVLLSIVLAGCDPWVERLADDLEDAGPIVIDTLAA